MEQKLTKILSKAKSWTDIFNEVSRINLEKPKLAGTLFEVFCKYYFLEDPSVRSDYKHVWLFEEAPQKIKKKLGFAKRDYGVDLLLEDKEGAFSVVQCKFRNNQSSNLSWSKDKIANLFAEGDKADYFIVFTNASGLDKHSKSKKEEKFKLFTLGNLLEIEPETIKGIVALLKHKKPPVLKKAKPRDYQRKAINDVFKGFKKNNRGQMILPCGAGKTLTALWVKEKLKSKHTLVLVPSLALLRQIKNEWHKHQHKWLPYLCVCSERDIDKTSGGDMPVVHTYEIGGNVTTNSKDIKKFLSTHKETIIYSTYQSLEAIQDALHRSRFSFDLVLCDEAHKTAGSKKSVFGIIHHQKKIPAKKRLYMTATPRIISAMARAKIGEDKLEYLADMSDNEIYGPEFHRMSFKEAINKKILVDYKILAIGISDEELQEAITIRKFVDDNYTIDEIANNFALEKTMKKYKAYHAITFHSSIKKADNFRDKHESLYPSVLTDHISGKQTTNNRKIILNDFEKSKKAIVTNARCLTEGVDVPVIDLVYFCDPKNSKVDIVQAAGRALRRSKHKDKKFGYIVVPIFHRSKEKTEETIENSAFKNLINVIRALCDQDERLQAEITTIRIGKGKRKAPSSTRHIKIIDEVPLIVMENFEDKLKQRLFSNVIEKIPIPWRSYEEARIFARSLGLKNHRDWIKYTKGEITGKPKLPVDIPTDPYQTYKHSGWVNLRDWLGTKTVILRYRKYKNYKDAKLFVYKLGIKNQKEWAKYTKGELLNKPILPDDIPKDPYSIYKSEGYSLGDWLGTGKVATRKIKFKSYSAACKFVKSLNLKNHSEWIQYTKGKIPGKPKLPNDIPASPYKAYKHKGWKSLGEWLGTRRVASHLIKYLPYKKARKFAHSLNLKSETEWRKYKKGEIPGKTNLPNNIPANPNQTYKKKGWKSMGDWLGTGFVAYRYRKYRSFEKARSFVHKLDIKNQNEWTRYCKGQMPEKPKLPKDIPPNPNQTYKKKEWKSMGDWLGTGYISPRLRKYRSYIKARNFVQKLELNSQNEWIKYSQGKVLGKPKLPKDIPANPYQYYKNKGWISLADWLGKK